MRTIEVLLLTSIVVAGGCVQYTPVSLSAVQPGEEVRIHVTDEGAVRLAQHIGRLTDEITAGVAPQASDSIAVTIWLGKNYQGTQFGDVRETVVMPRWEVTSLRRRQLSKWRTIALSAAAVAGTIVLAHEISQLGDPNKPDDDTTPIPPADVTPFRILFRWIPGGAR